MNAINLIDKIDSIKRVANAPNTALERSESPPNSSVKEPSSEEINTIVDKLNSHTDAFNERVHFSYNETLKRVIVKVVDQSTQETVREIPSKDIVSLLEHIQEHLGVLFDESR